MRPEKQKQQIISNSRIATLAVEGVLKILEIYAKATEFYLKRRSFKTGHLLYMSTVFDVLSRFRLCKGFPVVAKRTAKDARGNTVGTTEEWRSSDDITVALYLRSTQSVSRFIAKSAPSLFPPFPYFIL